MNLEKLKEIESKKIISGTGADIDHACVMQMVSYIADEPWSDHPKCACPVLTRFAIRINDRFDDDTRQLLKPLIPRLVGTRADLKTEIARAKFFALQAVTVFLPLLTNGLGLTEVSAKLRSFTVDQLNEAAAYCREQREGIRKANAADYAAYAAANAAANAAAAAAANADYAAYAAANAAYAAAYAAAANAATYAADKERWLTIKNQIRLAQITALELAIEVKG